MTLTQIISSLEVFKFLQNERQIAGMRDACKLAREILNLGNEIT